MALEASAKETDRQTDGEEQATLLAIARQPEATCSERGGERERGRGGNKAVERECIGVGQPRTEGGQWR